MNKKTKYMNGHTSCRDSGTSMTFLSVWVICLHFPRIINWYLQLNKGIFIVFCTNYVSQLNGFLFFFVSLSLIFDIIILLISVNIFFRYLYLLRAKRPNYHFHG